MINPAIPLQARLPEIQGPGDAAQSILPLKTLMDQEALRRAFVFTPEGELDQNATFANTARVNPLYALQLKRELNVEDFRGERTDIRRQQLQQQRAKLIMDAMKRPWASAASSFLFNGDLAGAQGLFKKQMQEVLPQLGIDPVKAQMVDWTPEMSDKVLSGQMDQQYLQQAVQHERAGLPIGPTLMRDTGEIVQAGGGEGAEQFMPTGGHFQQEEPGKWWTHEPRTPEEGQKWGKLMSILSTQKGFKANQPYITLPIEAGGGMVKNPYYWQAKEDEFKLKSKYNIGTGTTVNVDGNMGLTKAEQNRVQEMVVDTDKGIARLRNVRESFDPSFLELPTQAWMSFLRFGNKMGIPLSATQKEALENYSTFRYDAFDNMNRYIKEITGAAMGEVEAGRLRKAIPDPENDAPVEFKAKMDRSMTVLERAGNLFKDLLKRGISVEKANREVADMLLDTLAPRKPIKKGAPTAPAAPQGRAAPSPDPLGIR